MLSDCFIVPCVESYDYTILLNTRLVVHLSVRPSGELLYSRSMIVQHCHRSKPLSHLNLNTSSEVCAFCCSSSGVRVVT